LAAIGLFLTLRPAPYADPAPTFEAVEVSIVPEPSSGSRPNELSANNPGDVSAMPFPSLTRRDVTATPQPSDWPDVSMRGMFDLPAPPAFGTHALAPGLDMLGAMLDCLEDSRHEGPRRPLHAHPPCPYADVPFRSPMAKLETSQSESSGGALRTGVDYRAFKTIPPLFDESLFPEKAPQANRALKQWFMGLFH
jgi:hypothetical protein